MGLLAGFALVWAGANTILALLFQVTPFDPVTLAGVAAVIVMRR